LNGKTAIWKAIEVKLGLNYCVASCWFFIYYRLMMHGNSNIRR